MRVFAAMTFAGVMCAAAPLAGQSALKPFRQASGAAEINVGVASVVDHLSYEIAAAMLLPRPSPWAIQVPDSNIAIWKQVRDGLFAALHGRPVKPSDLSYQAIEIGPAIVRSDSLFASFTIRTEWYCAPSPTLVIPAGGGWSGSSSEVLVTSVRNSGHWSPATYRSGLTVDGGCVYKQ